MAGWLVERETSKYNLKSTYSLLLQVPRIKSQTLGDRSFAMAAPKLWNGLPRDLRETKSLVTFKRHLKTYFFKLAYY